MGQDLLQPGVGSFGFSDRCVPTRGVIRVFYCCPQSVPRDTPIVIAMHGLDRAAEAFRDGLAERALRNEQIVLVPEFDARQFPGVHAYNFGGVRRPPPDGTINAREEWNFGLIDRLFLHVRNAIGSNRAKFGMFGNSAGSQYVLRYLALTDAHFVERAVASNCGAYMLPDLAAEYPTGMGGLDLDKSHLRRYFAQPLVILLGDADTDTSAPDLPRSAVAMSQGPHRFARGHWHFAHCTELAARLGAPLHWKLEVVPGAGHIAPEIFERGLDVLKLALR